MTQKKVRPHIGTDAETFHANAPKPRVKPAKAGEAFGVEGTNKTIAQPKPDGEPPEELGPSDRLRFIAKSPYTRG